MGALEVPGGPAAAPPTPAPAAAPAVPPPSAGVLGPTTPAPDLAPPATTGAAPLGFDVSQPWFSGATYDAAVHGNWLREGLGDWFNNSLAGRLPASISGATPGYDPFSDAQTKGYEDYFTNWMDSKNPAQTAQIIAGLDRHERNAAVMAQSGWSGFLLANATDPINAAFALPGIAGIAGKGAEFLGSTALRSGRYGLGVFTGVGDLSPAEVAARGMEAPTVQAAIDAADARALALDGGAAADVAARTAPSLVARAGLGAAVFGGVGAASEVAQTALQGEAVHPFSPTSIVLQAAIGGLLGGLGHFFAEGGVESTRTALLKSMRDVLNEDGAKSYKAYEPPARPKDFTPEQHAAQDATDAAGLAENKIVEARLADAAAGRARAQSVGAASADEMQSLEDNTPAPSAGAARLSALPGPTQSPTSFIAFQPSNVARWVSRLGFEQPFRYVGEQLGKRAPAAAETRRLQWIHKSFAGERNFDLQFANYRFGQAKLLGNARAAIADSLGKGNGLLSRRDFAAAVADAMRNGDAHAIPEVANAAQFYRRTLVEPLKQEAIAYGLLTPDVKTETAASYFSRVYDTVKIRAQRNIFQKTIADWLRSERANELAADPAVMKKWEASRDAALEAVKVAENELGSFQRKVTEQNARATNSGTVKKILKREVQIRGQRVAKLERTLADAKARAEKFATTAKGNLLPKDHPFRQMIMLAKSPPKEPLRLTDFLRKTGVKDAGGELVNLDIKTPKGKKGLIAKHDDPHALTLERAAERAAEEGYLGPKIEGGADVADPTYYRDRLIEALQQDQTTPVYAEGDPVTMQHVSDYRTATSLRADLEAANIPIDLPPDKIAQRLDAFAGGEGKTPIAPTATRSERARGGAYYERAVARDLKGEQAALDQSKVRAGETDTRITDAIAERNRLLAHQLDIIKERDAASRAHDTFSGAIEQAVQMQHVGDHEIDDIARQIVDKITGLGGRMTYIPAQVVGHALKARTLNIPDKLIENWLLNDAPRVMRMHAHQVGTDVELARTFGRPDMRDQLEAVRADYARLIKAAETDPKTGERVPNEKAVTRLGRQERQTLQTLENMRDRMKGIYELPRDPEGIMNRIRIGLRSFNLITRGGGFLTASVPDLGNIIATHGILRLSRDGFGRLMNDTKGFKLLAREVEAAGTSLDLVMDTRNHTLFDIGNEYGHNSKFERFLSAMGDKYGLINGLTIWNNAVKKLTGVITITRILEASEALAKGLPIEAKELERLHWLGIDENTARDIVDMATKFGTREPGKIWQPNVGAWYGEGGARDAADIFRAAVVKESDSTIVTPKQEKPFWLSKPLVGLIGQFRSFTLSSMARTTTRVLQQRDRNALQGVIAMIGLGALAYYLKTTPQQRANSTPQVWAREAVDRSSITAWLFDANNMLEKVFGGHIGLSSLGVAQSQRYASRGSFGALFGPTFGLGEDIRAMIDDAAAHKWTDADTTKARHLVPFLNLFYLRWLMEANQPTAPEPAGGQMR